MPRDIDDLSTLGLEQSKMSLADFDELETVLRAAVPEAFAPAPPPAPSEGSA